MAQDELTPDAIAALRQAGTREASLTIASGVVRGGVAARGGERNWQVLAWVPGGGTPPAGLKGEATEPADGTLITSNPDHENADALRNLLPCGRSLAGRPGGPPRRAEPARNPARHRRSGAPRQRRRLGDDVRGAVWGEREAYWSNFATHIGRHLSPFATASGEQAAKGVHR